MEEMQERGRMRAVRDVVSNAVGQVKDEERISQTPLRNSPGEMPSGKRSSEDLKQGVQTVSDRVHSNNQQNDPVCDVCKGRGFVTLDVFPGHPKFLKPLQCTACSGARKPELHLATYGLPEKLQVCTFDKVVRHPGNAAAYDAALDRARHPREFLTLQGSTGVGKSMLQAAIIREALSLGLSAFYTTTADLLDYIRATFRHDSNEGYEARWERLKSVRVLCLDELDRFNPSDWAQEKFFQLVSSRYDNGLDRLTCFATNARIETFPEYFQSRIRDRRSCLFELTGMDVRLCARSTEPVLVCGNAHEHLILQSGDDKPWRARAIRRGLRDSAAARPARRGATCRWSSWWVQSAGSACFIPRAARTRWR